MPPNRVPMNLFELYIYMDNLYGFSISYNIKTEIYY